MRRRGTVLREIARLKALPATERVQTMVCALEWVLDALETSPSEVELAIAARTPAAATDTITVTVPVQRPLRSPVCVSPSRDSQQWRQSRTLRNGMRVVYGSRVIKGEERRFRWKDGEGEVYTSLAEAVARVFRSMVER